MLDRNDADSATLVVVSANQFFKELELRLRRRRPAPNTIETDSAFDVSFWMQELRVSRSALLYAIQTVGRDASSVRLFLATHAMAVGATASSSVDAGPQDGGHKPEALCSVQYVSRAALTLTSEDLEAILSWSREFNRAHEISGVLLFTGRHFSQILEGPFEAVHTLMDAIRIDARHQDVRIVSDVASANRNFKGWAMAWVEDFGQRYLLEELWWVGVIDSMRASELVQHLRHCLRHGELALMHEAEPLPSEGSTRYPSA